ncbi:OmpH family outer membrane protein [Candidatus Pelagibacter sp.]|uniref:OmpH family outer membrane protein n=1 Tax=Candidatus Pelagibacter sp. TaxID=2024849 RepID=UPI003F83C8D1
MKFYFKIFLISICFTSIASSNEKNTIRYIDLNYIINESIAGKKIKQKLENENSKKIEEFKKIENSLLKKKNEILSKQNILSKEDFEKNVIEHQNKVADLQRKKKKNFDEFNNKKINLTNLLLKEIDKILLDYSKTNSIDMILKKEFLIISNSKLDITKDILVLVDNEVKQIKG